MFLYSSWLRLPIVTRHHIARVFNIPKIGATEVSDNQVVKDGYKIDDIESKLTVDALQVFLDTDETNFKYLWEDMVNKVEGKPLTVREVATIAVEEEPIATIEETMMIKEVIETIPAPKKRGRPKKT